ncbi:spore coat protein GerQ [Oceanobacillus sp. CAU 1775]
MNEEKETPQQPEYNYGFQAPQFPPNPYAAQPMPMFQQRQMAPQGTGTGQGMLPMQQSYIENILRLNRGKQATVHLTFEGNNQRTFTGIIEAAGRDHIILSEEGTGRRVLLLMVYLDYVTFNEEINYEYPYSDAQFANYPPR